MTTVVQTRTGHIGYRHQLDRVRRFRGYLEGPHANDVEFQDFMWSFFQHCWHLKDWVQHDPLASATQKAAVQSAAYASPQLVICQDMCNGTKHLQLDRPQSGAGAQHSHIETRIVPGGSATMDCRLDDGHGNLISGRQLMQECITEWERILTAQNLSILALP